MKIKVTEVSNNSGRFVVTDNDAPVVGIKYALEDAENATSSQNRAFHALITEYWSSGMHSYPVKTFGEFRDQIKLKLGAGFEKIIYADIEGNKAVIFEVKTRAEVPAHILADPDLKRMVKGKLLSWSEYSKKQRTDTIDRLIAEMHAAGCNSKKFELILAGMA